MPAKKPKGKPNILVITPVKHIAGVSKTLEKIGNVTYLEDPTELEVKLALVGKQAIFTNPNKSNVYLGENVLAGATDLQVICTASTGTNHIDLEYAKARKLKVVALTTDMTFIRKISSTAELAFALTLAALRHIPPAFDHVKAGEWDYTQFIGRQMDHLTVGVVGYGRLGSFYAKYALAFGSQVLVYDPYVKVRKQKGLTQVKKIDQLLKASDIIALHVHVTPETTGMVNKKWFSKMKKTVLLVNTSRGEIINEGDLLEFLKANPEAMLAADVVANEVKAKGNSPLVAYAKKASNLLLTPHIGGMTREGQAIAYNRAADKLKAFFKK